jgi:16S rRNA (cytosine967-C5)-methyltransferase
MNVLGISTKVLKDVIDQKKSVHLSLASLKEQYNISKVDDQMIQQTVNGALRHFYLLRYEAMEAFPEYQRDDDEIYLLALALYQIRYMKKTIASFQVVDEAASASEFLSLRLERNDFEERLSPFGKDPYKFSPEVRKDVFKYLSLFFSAPEWLISMWAEQYGDEVMMSLLKSSQAHRHIFVRRNHLKAAEKELLKEDIYSNTLIAEEALIFHSPYAFSTQDDYKEGKAFIEDLSIQIISDSFNIPQGEKILHIGGITGALSSDLAIKATDKKSTVDACFEKEGDYRKAIYLYQRLGLNNIKAYMADAKLAEAKLPLASYGLVVVSPKSSYFGQIAKRPALLATIEEKDLANLIKGEMESLEESAKFVAKGGQLIYLVNTVDQNEGEKLILAFLTKHPDFTLADSRQIFPYEFNSEGAYVAYLSKEA